MTSGLAAAAKVAGRSIFFIGTGVSIAQGTHALYHGQYGMAGKAELDLAMGALGTFGGVPGLVVSGVYFGVDYFIGWDKVGDAFLNATPPSAPMSPRFRYAY